MKVTFVSKKLNLSILCFENFHQETWQLKGLENYSNNHEHYPAGVSESPLWNPVQVWVRVTAQKTDPSPSLSPFQVIFLRAEIASFTSFLNHYFKYLSKIKQRYTSKAIFICFIEKQKVKRQHFSHHIVILVGA